MVVKNMVKIDSAKFGEISIDGKVYYSDVAVWWNGKVALASKSHEFDILRLQELAGKKPDIIVVGTGMQGMLKVLPEVKQVCDDDNLTIYYDPTPKAIDMFNGLILQGKKVAGFFHLTN
jgi:hypothetical protein